MSFPGLEIHGEQGPACVCPMSAMAKYSRGGSSPDSQSWSSQQGHLEVSVSMWMALTRLGDTEESFLFSPAVLPTHIIHHDPSSLLFQQEFLSQEGCAPRHGKSQLHRVWAESFPLLPSEQAQAACQGNRTCWPGWRCPLWVSVCQDSSSGGNPPCCQLFLWRGGGLAGWDLVRAVVTGPWTLCGGREEQGGRMGPVGQPRCELSRLRWLSCC